MSRDHANINVSCENKVGDFDARQLSFTNCQTVYLVDNGSMHGTWVNDSKVLKDHSIPVTPLDVVTFGAKIVRGSGRCSSNLCRVCVSMLMTQKPIIPFKYSLSATGLNPSASSPLTVTSIDPGREENAPLAPAQSSNSFSVPDDDEESIPDLGGSDGSDAENMDPDFGGSDNGDPDGDGSDDAASAGEPDIAESDVDHQEVGDLKADFASFSSTYPFVPSFPVNKDPALRDVLELADQTHTADDVGGPKVKCHEEGGPNEEPSEDNRLAIGHLLDTSSAKVDYLSANVDAPVADEGTTPKRVPKRKADELEFEPPSTEPAVQTSLTAEESFQDAQPQAVNEAVSPSPQISDDAWNSSPQPLKETPTSSPPLSDVPIPAALESSAHHAPASADTRPRKRPKISHTRKGPQPRTGFAAHATTAAIGVLVGGLGTIAALASLPSEYFS